MFHDNKTFSFWKDSLFNIEAKMIKFLRNLRLNLLHSFYDAIASVCESLWINIWSLYAVSALAESQLKLLKSSRSLNLWITENFFQFWDDYKWLR